MSLRSIQRRLDALECRQSAATARVGDRYTVAEMASLVDRVLREEKLNADEQARLQRWGPAYAGEVAVYANGGALLIKRYVGVDLGEV